MRAHHREPGSLCPCVTSRVGLVSSLIFCILPGLGNAGEGATWCLKSRRCSRLTVFTPRSRRKLVAGAGVTSRHVTSPCLFASQAHLEHSQQARRVKEQLTSPRTCRPLSSAPFHAERERITRSYLSNLSHLPSQTRNRTDSRQI